MNFRYPVFLDVRGKKCLVLGGGPETFAKIRALLDANASVVYIHGSAEPAISDLAGASLIEWQRRAFQPQDLDDCFLVITDLEDNSEVFRMAEERRILCNAIDDPEHCRLIFGSMLRRGDLTIAVSTNGCSPALAVRLRQQLEEQIGPEYTELLPILRELRPQISARFPDFGVRRDLWYRLVDSEALDQLRSGQREAAVETLRRIIEETVSSTSRSDTSA